MTKTMLNLSYTCERLELTPTQGSLGAAGIDLRSDMDLVVDPGRWAVVRTGVSMAIPEGYVGELHVRSSLALKRGLRLANSTGIIDSDYRGEIMAVLYNDSDRPQMVERFERIVQLVIVPVPRVGLARVEELPGTARGAGGFGSTGKE